LRYGQGAGYNMLLCFSQVDCVGIIPAWPRPWVALLTQLPVRARERLAHRSDMFLPGALIPERQRLPKAPRYAVWAYYIIW